MKMLELDKHRVFGTDGSGHQKKCWVRTTGGFFLIKVNSKYHEDEKEHSASVILSAAKVPHVSYAKLRVSVGGREHNACSCASFLRQDESSISFASFIQRDFSIPVKEPAKVIFSRVCRRVADVTGLGELILREYVLKLMAIDYLFCNEDRHYSNMEVVFSPNGARLAPYFDFGKSFLGLNYEPSRVDVERRLRNFKTMPFSSNPSVNLIDRVFAKRYCGEIVSRIRDSGGIDALGINSWHKKLFKMRVGQLLALKD